MTRNFMFSLTLPDIVHDSLANYQQSRSTDFFFNMGQPRPLLFVFTVKLFYNNDLQTGHSVETIPHLCQVVFAFWTYLSSREGILKS